MDIMGKGIVFLLFMLHTICHVGHGFFSLHSLNFICHFLLFTLD